MGGKVFIDQISLIVLIAGGLGTLIAICKNIIDLYTSSTIRARSEHEFTNSFAELLSDPVLRSYANELAYKAMIGAPELTTAQRQSLLCLPNRVRSIPRYLATRRLFSVHTSGQILRWKLKRHQWRWYRMSLKGILFLIYAVLASVGFASFLGPYPATSYPSLDRLLALPALGSIYLIFLAGWVLFHSIKLSTAEQLIEEVELVGPFNIN